MNTTSEKGGMARTLHADDSGSSASDVDHRQHRPTTTTVSPGVAATTTSVVSPWTGFVNRVRAPIVQAVKKLAVQSATFPQRTIAMVIFISFGLFITGIFTNFSVDVDEDVLWTPTKSNAVKSMNWLNDKSGFPIAPRTTLFLFHADGDATNVVLTKDFIRKSFAPLDAVRNLPDYETICARFENQTKTCDITGITQFWNHSISIFDATVQTDQDVLDTLAQEFFPDGTPVPLNSLVGNLRFDDQNNIVGAQSFTVIMDFPEDGDDSTVMEDFEEQVLDKIFAVQKELERDDDTFRFETIADRSFPDEFGRAIINDIPLAPIVFVIMGMFTSAIFYKKDRVQSRSTLGFMAVVSILLSILAGYGLMFVCGVPFTSMTQILPFVFFGVGLDDAFIITGSYFRMDPKRDVVERVGETMEEIGLSIFLTTLTSCLAFGLSAISSIPAVFWLCIYAVPTMALILLWQLTFFVACLAIDEQRVAAGKGDGIRRFIHCGGKPAAADETAAHTTEVDAQVSTVDRYMVHYAHFILQPVVRVIVILAFLGLAIACGFSTAELEQAFKFTEVLPAGSYITEFVNALKAYSESSSVYPAVYFRNEDQSDPAIRAQMDAFVNELVVDVAAAANKQPDFCWFRDFDKFVTEDAGGSLADQTFVKQLDAFLANDVYSKLYREDIVLDDQSGSILVSRCILSFDDVDLEDVVVQIDALEEQLAVTERQPINEDKSEFSFFTYESTYNIWEFYAKSAEELALTTILSVVSVVAVTLLLVPHWTAAPIILPLISIMYIDMLGVLQWAGISVNPVSYITLVMSIGLLVDFLLHVLLRYYECPGTRYEKAVETLRTMGSSVLIGGITTFLGTLPLAFSTSDIFQTVFIAFLALVVLGVTHGLLLLPLILSLIGPEDHVVALSSSSATAVANVPTVKKEETARGVVVVAKSMPPKTIRPDSSLEEITC